MTAVATAKITLTVTTTYHQKKGNSLMNNLEVRLLAERIAMEVEPYSELTVEETIVLINKIVNGINAYFEENK